MLSFFMRSRWDRRNTSSFPRPDAGWRGWCWRYLGCFDSKKLEGEDAVNCKSCVLRIQDLKGREKLVQRVNQRIQRSRAILV